MKPLDGLHQALDGHVRGRLETDVELRRMTTYRLGGPAALYLEPSDVSDLEALGRALKEVEEEVPVLPVGRGSNLVVSDSGFPGVCIHLGAGFETFEAEAAGAARVGAAAALPQVTNWTARRGWAGFEFAIAIPGSVGGGVRMNAGAHGGDMAACLVGATIFSLTEAGVDLVNAADLGFSYRRSALTDRDIVLDARLQLREDDAEAVKARVEANRRHRAETQPPAVQNAGSVFKNPHGDHAGRLVEAAGLKGFAVGAASVSELHANFFIASTGAGAQDVFDLVHAVRAKVEQRFGVVLEPEIRFVGSFREPSR